MYIQFFLVFNAAKKNICILVKEINLSTYLYCVKLKKVVVIAYLLTLQVLLNFSLFCFVSKVCFVL